GGGGGRGLGVVPAGQGGKAHRPLHAEAGVVPRQAAGLRRLHRPAAPPRRCIVGVRAGEGPRGQRAQREVPGRARRIAAQGRGHPHHRIRRGDPDLRRRRQSDRLSEKERPMLALLTLFALVLIFGPVGATLAGHPLAPLPTVIMTASGIVLAIGVGVIWMITALYMKTRASEAFVRTGMGGMRVIKDGGALVMPVVHQIVKISLRTLRLDVGREGPDALITKDKLRADIKAEFFVRV